MNQSDPLLAKIRKLLAMAESPAATAAEAEAFTAKAARLVADYGIDRALLAQRDPERDLVGDRVIGLDPPYARAKASLASTIAHALRCRAVLRKQATLEHTSISLHVFGHESDLICVEMLFTSLLLQGAQALAGTPLPPGEHVAAYRRTWWAGFTSAIADRLEESERRAAAGAEARFAAAGTSAALVLADRSEDSEAALRQAYPRIRNAGRRRLSGGGVGDGWTSGQGADLGFASRVAGTTRRELSG